MLEERPSVTLALMQSSRTTGHGHSALHLLPHD